MPGNKSIFYSIKMLPTTQAICLVDDETTLHITGIGIILIKVGTYTITIENVLYVSQ